MRKTKRFTPQVLERFRKEGRGIGTFRNYASWHQVGRGDPSSNGRSHLLIWGQRQLDLLSDIELVGAYFLTMLPSIQDIRTQFPLSLTEGRNELSDYQVNASRGFYPGTLEIARKLQIRHPKIYGDGTSCDWVLTTDLLGYCNSRNNDAGLIAVAIKPVDTLSKRKLQLLQIEAEYWKVREVTWLLVTPSEYDKTTALTLRCAEAWALGMVVSKEAKCCAIEVANRTLGQSFTYMLNALTNQLNNHDLAQRAFWQSVWYGDIPLDLRRGWRPHLPLKLLERNEFSLLNPISSRRSAWN